MFESLNRLYHLFLTFHKNIKLIIVLSITSENPNEQ
jgi:hypothetical protein